MIPKGMLPQVRFTKMHGLGNDFVILSEFGVGFSQSPIFVDAKLASRLSDRRFGIGCDQLLVVGPARDGRSHARMDVWNPDGSRAEMCGNGIRAVALFLHDQGPERLRGLASYDIETAAGVKTVTLQGRQVRVNMGAPVFMSIRPESLTTEVGVFDFWEVNMGNPHAVIFVPQVDQVELEKVGPILENHSRFERRTNVEFVQVLSSTHLKVRVWERGAGATLACGTGACASAVAAILSSVTHSRLTVSLPGGDLQLEWSKGELSPVWMTGPAVEVFRGQT